MAISGISGLDSLSSLISMQSTLKSAGAVKSAQNELHSEASVYKPSIGFAGDAQKANAITAKADSLNGSIGKITAQVQDGIQKTNDAASSQSSKQSDDAASSDKTTDPPEQDGPQDPNAQKSDYAIYNRAGSVVNNDVSQVSQLNLLV